MSSRNPSTLLVVSFLNTYYKEFISAGSFANSVQPFYGAQSRIACRGHPQLEINATGEKEIQAFLSRIDLILKGRKIEILWVDSSPLPDGSVQIVAQGTLYLRGSKWNIHHIFVLSPTANRLETYYISSEHLFFISLVEEKIPKDAKLLRQGELAALLAENKIQQTVEVAVSRPQEAQTAKQVLEHRRDQRVRTEELERPSAASGAVHTNANTNFPQQSHTDPRDGRQGPKIFANTGNRNGPRDGRFVEGNRGHRDARGGRDNYRQDRRVEEDGRQEGRQGNRGENVGKQEGRQGNRGENVGKQEVRQEPPQQNENELQKNGKADNSDKRRNRNSRRNEAPKEGLASQNPTDANASVKLQEAAEKKDNQGETNDRSRPARDRKNNNRGGKKADGEKSDERAGEKPAKSRNGATTFVRVANAASLSLDIVRDTFAKLVAMPVDVKRFGRDNTQVVVKLCSESEAETIYSKNMVDFSGTKYKVMPFYA